jgi:transposase InsO family protein
LAPETQALILEMANSNPRWGCVRIKGELQKLGIRVSATTIRNLLRRRRVPPAPRRNGPTWREFLRAHASAIVMVDFFTLETVFLRTLYVIVFLELGSRRILWAACTQHPDDRWVTQQARNAVYAMQDRDLKLRFAIHDRDDKFTAQFDAVLTAEEAEVMKSPYRAPKARAHIERAIGSARREFFDFMVVAGEPHLRHLLKAWILHYNCGRPHMALGLAPPEPQPIGHGDIIRERTLCGLTTDYRRAA